MSVVCPTVLATTKEEYDLQMKRAAAFAPRIQIDLMDGDFASPQSVNMDAVWWPEGVIADMHIMYRHPRDYISKLMQLRPSLVIIHAEAEVDHKLFADKLHQNGISAGLCLLADTSVDKIKDIIEHFDHLLIFGGTLGSFGGQANLELLEKVKQAIELKPTLEIGWDGGVNEQIAGALSEGGIDVLNAGGFIQKSEDPKSSYEKLVSIVE